MRNKIWIVFILPVLLVVIGCARITETTKAILGTSTKDLEEERVNAITKTYACDLSDVFDEVLRIAEKRKLVVFSKNRTQRRIVLMKIPESIDTTEVGVFFSYLDKNKTEIEITSLSPSAKQTASEIIFLDLSELYQETNE